MASPLLIDFSPLGDLANTYRQAQQQRETSDWLQSQGLPGNFNLAQLALMNQRDARDFAFRQQEAQRSQGNVDRAFALQKQQADEAARGFDYREVDDGQGGKTFVRVNKQTGATEKVPIAGAPDVPSNPYAQGKMNDEQAKAAIYANRMMASEKILRDIDAATATSPWQKFLGAASDRVGVNMRSPEYQKFDQAQRDFINATLRRESGAAISESEFANARQQYFPQPGDTVDVLKQKRANRAEAIRGIAIGAGRGYRPDSIFNDKGEIIDNPAPKSGQQQAAPDAWRSKETVTAARANPQQTLQDARDVIARNPGARDQVILRLRAVGIDPSGL